MRALLFALTCLAVGPRMVLQDGSEGGLSPMIGETLPSYRVLTRNVLLSRSSIGAEWRLSQPQKTGGIENAALS